MSISRCLNGIFRIWGEPLASKLIWNFPIAQDNLIYVTGIEWAIQSHILIPTWIQHNWGHLVNPTRTFVNDLILMMETGLCGAMGMMVCQRALALWTDIPPPTSICVVLGPVTSAFGDLALVCLPAEWGWTFLTSWWFSGFDVVLHVKDLAFCPARDVLHILVSVIITIPYLKLALRRATGRRSHFYKGLHALLRSALESWNLLQESGK